MNDKWQAALTWLGAIMIWTVVFSTSCNQHTSAQSNRSTYYGDEQYRSKTGNCYEIIYKFGDIIGTFMIECPK